MDIQQRYELITQNTQEVLTEESIRHLLKTNTSIKHYIGFEISGKIHIGTGIVCMSKIKDFLDAGVECTIFLADWHSWINDKLGGDQEVIREVALGYFKEGLKASLRCVGADPQKVRFVLGSDLYHHNDSFWRTVIDVSKHTTLARMERSITILGRKEGGNVDFAKLLYPPMQVADIFIQGVNLAQAGLDQRKAQVIAREVGEKLSHPLRDANGAVIKPSAVHHHLILGLGQPPKWPLEKEELQELWSTLKMSKSKPNTAVFIHDTPEEIREKMKQAFCPQGEIEFNPVLDWCKHVIFVLRNKLQITRPEKYGGTIVFNTYAELEKAFQDGVLHPTDLKNAVAESLIDILSPAREYFSSEQGSAMLEKMNSLLITR